MIFYFSGFENWIFVKSNITYFEKRPALRAGGSYIGLNKIKNDVIKYDKNINQVYQDAISDDQIESIGFALFDIDTKRQTKLDTMATIQEIEVAKKQGQIIIDYLKEKGIEFASVVFSGNGTQILVKLPNYSIEKSKEFGKIFSDLKERFQDLHHVDIDTTVKNASRICRMPGTMNIKGTGNHDRPHRLAELVELNPESAEVDVLKIMKNVTSEKNFHSNQEIQSEFGELERVFVETFEAAGFYRGKGSNNCHRIRCLYSDSHSANDDSSSDTVAFINKNGSIVTHCHHNSCQNLNKSIYAYLDEFEKNGIDTSKLKSLLGEVKYFPINNTPITKVPLVCGDNGPKTPKPNAIANHLFDAVGGDLRRWNNDLFVWNRKHWQYVDDPIPVYNIIHEISSGLLSQQTAESVWRTLLGKVPKFDLNPWEQNHYKLALSNGNLCLEQINNQWIVNLYQHRKEDDLIGCIDVHFDPKASSSEFEKEITSLLGPADIEDRKKALSEMYGLILYPVIPRLFSLIGPPGTGKSTIAKVGLLMMSESTVSGVDPSNYNKFYMESMLGKRANVCLDVDFTVPIYDANIKKIEDEKQVQVDRKFKTPVQARLPNLHIFCSNDHLMSRDRGTGAYERRWTIMRIDSKRFNQETQIKNYADQLFSAHSSAVLNFAIEGILRILRNGKRLTVPTSSKNEMKRWLISADPMRLFVHEIRNDENDTIAIQIGGKLPRTDLWDQFVIWFEKAYCRKPFVSKIQFYDRMDAEFGESKSNGNRIVKGVILRAADNPAKEREFDGVSFDPGY